MGEEGCGGCLWEVREVTGRERLCLVEELVLYGSTAQCVVQSSGAVGDRLSVDLWAESTGATGLGGRGAEWTRG